MATPVEFVAVQTQRAKMAAETNTLFGHGRRLEAKGRGNLPPEAKNADSALREEARV